MSSMESSVATKYVYEFSEGSKEQRDLLGGKGANVAEMTRVLGADRVPAGFTITTEACVAYMDAGGEEPAGLIEQVATALGQLERATGKQLGDASDPLLVSVRSGARESMPGMLDTVLNLGLSDSSVIALAERTSNDRFAWDSYRRFTQMFGNVVRGVPSERYEDEISRIKLDRGVKLDTELDTDALRELTEAFKQIFADHTGEEFPQEPREQLSQAIRAVFDSWLGDRAVEYRRINGIPNEWGTAVNVQQMVFGNKGLSSGSGVAFSRDEIDGAPEPSGDFLANAQGEDVVSGVRNTQDLDDLRDLMPEAHAELIEILGLLERHYGDMQDTEFTIEEGRLYMLQTRSAKRPAQAAVRFAVDAVAEGLLSREQALLTIDPETLDALLHPTFSADAKFELLARGVSASPGAAKGKVVFSAPDAVAASQAGEAVILVRRFTEADDVAGFHAARGILTSEGGKASHAALVARGMGRPCVCGASALEINHDAGEFRVGDTVVRAGDVIAIDGSSGAITVDDVELVEPELDKNFAVVLAWSDELRELGVRTNADLPEDAIRAREFGAQGIGLVRTEHMFMAADRQPTMRAMIMAQDEPTRRSLLGELQPHQQRDFEGIFEAMAGLPVTIRLLDPPLHEFLPDALGLERELFEANTEAQSNSERIAELERTLERVTSLQEVNPMLGTRGCRLGILYPEIYEMQVRAIALAALAVGERTGSKPLLEVMIPLVDYEKELEIMRKLVIRAASEEGMQHGLDFTVGTMIELPRACLVADLIAEEADFFSFGTNDLTQTVLGFSRDDVESSFLVRYMDEGVVDRSPFETIDRPGVGEMVRIAAASSRKVRPQIKLGVCGEHGGDPDSVQFFHEVGVDYVSCSPFRVPIARVAAAQAAVRKPYGGLIAAS